MGIVGHTIHKRCTMSRFGLSLLLAIALAAICSATPSVPSVTPASPVTSAETPSTPSPESPTPGSPPPSPPPTDTFTESDLIPDIGAVDLHLSGNVIARAICTGCGSQAEQLRRDIAAILDISHKAMTTLDYQQPAGRFEAVIRLFDTVRAGRVVGAKTLANELAQHLEDSDAN